MTSKPIIFGSDHAGLGLKKELIAYLSPKYELIDVGTKDENSCDYPVYARKLCQEVLDRQTLGILICGSGIGMSITANRFQGIRAALCLNEYMARMARMHNDANVLCLGDRIIGVELAKSIVDVFLEASFEGGRHLRRIQLIDSLE